MFYDNYVRLCNQIGKSPSAVAQEIGFAKPTVTRWKKDGGVSDATLFKVADYFGVSVDDLRGDVKEQQKKPAPEKGEREYSDQVLLDAFNRADEATKAAIRLLLKVE